MAPGSPTVITIAKQGIGFIVQWMEVSSNKTKQLMCDRIIIVIRKGAKLHDMAEFKS